MQARAYGAPVVAPQSEPIWGVVERAAPFQGSAIAEYIYGEDVPLVPVTNPVTNTPPQVSRQVHQRKCTPCASGRTLLCAFGGQCGSRVNVAAAVWVWVVGHHTQVKQ